MWLRQIQRDCVICDHFELDVFSFQTGGKNSCFVLADTQHQNGSWEDLCRVTYAALGFVVARIFLTAASGSRSCPDDVLLLLLLIGGATVWRMFLVEYCPDCSFRCLLFDNKV